MSENPKAKLALQERQPEIITNEALNQHFDDCTKRVIEQLKVNLSQQNEHHIQYNMGQPGMPGPGMPQRPGFFVSQAKPKPRMSSNTPPYVPGGQMQR